ncbi:OmpH family outer membrane protein [Prevotella aurantiaca JCM 15754]|uniref:OmpH family outer membrane protein n=1 Tax=Prevotella aurantiaca TaxID=596085 RepID=UPI000469F52B|nr:OmpH family outer membrane protein [Prevotella aurantiaca]
MKKTLSAIAVAALAFGITSCNNQPQANDTKETKKPAAATATSSSQENIAYVEIDSIMSQYTYWKEVTKILEAKEKNIQKTLAGKQQALQQAAANFQRNIQANKYTQEQAQQIQAGIQKQAADAESLQQRLGAEYQKEVSNYNKALSDSVHNYLKSFNKDKKYVMILAKSGDNILYADEACNITSDVVKGMNKAYTGMKK